jgi:dUTP pyrophosphatase
MAELWERLWTLAVKYSQSPDILTPWLDGFLRKVTSEYGSKGTGWDVKGIRDLALDAREAVSEASMELLLQQKQDAIEEIATMLRGSGDNTASNKPALRIRKVYSDARMPQQVTAGASRLDIFAYMKGEQGAVMIGEQPELIGSGIAVEVPHGYDVQIRPRLGLSGKGIMVASGTVDSDYRGEVMVTMYAVGASSGFQVRHGDRIARLVVGKLADLPIQEAEELSSTERGPQGHGSTGIR